MATTRKITNSHELKEAMTELEKKVGVQELEVKFHYNQVKENLHPKRVMKNTFSYVGETPELQRILVNTVIGFILGYASKKAVQLFSENALNSTVENLVNTQVHKLENKKPGSFLSRGISLFRKHTPPHSPIYPFVRYK